MMYSKHISKILSLLLVIFLSGVLVAHAYTPLAPLPIGEGGTTPKEYASMGTYLAGMIKFLIAVGGVIAIVMAIIGGVQYIASGITPSGKEAAKKRIEDALVGLALILASYLILNSINPDLVKLNLDLPVIQGTRRTVSTTTAASLNTQVNDFLKVCGISGGELCDDSNFGWGGIGEAIIRNRLKNSGISTNHGNCLNWGDKGCTSLNGLGQSAIDGLIKLTNDCNCAVSITGGTEEWLHKTHGPGKSIVDLSKNPSLDAFIKNTLTKETTTNGIMYYPASGGKYLDETNSDMSTGAHWHVTF